MKKLLVQHVQKALGVEAGVPANITCIQSRSILGAVVFQKTKRGVKVLGTTGIHEFRVTAKFSKKKQLFYFSKKIRSMYSKKFVPEENKMTTVASPEGAALVVSEIVREIVTELRI